jgi:NADP-dependent 3-hydroxy acid dehydrogenase YdfG
MNEPLREPSQSSVLVVGVGASRGLGAAIARRFWRGGHPVVIAGRNTEKLEKTAKELKDAGPRLLSSLAMRRTRTMRSVSY